MLLKRRMAGEVSTHLTAWKQAALVYAAWNGGEGPGKGERGEGKEQYRIQGKQVEEIEIELQRDDAKAFCFLCSLR